MIETINFTIFIQAFNFFIVCLLLKYLFFKPAIEALDEENNAKTTLEEGISHQHSLLQEKITRKEDTWIDYQAHFLKTSPSVKPKPIVMFKEEIQPEKIKVTQKEIEQLTQQIQSSLVKRIEHVRE